MDQTTSQIFEAKCQRRLVLLYPFPIPLLNKMQHWETEATNPITSTCPPAVYCFPIQALVADHVDPFITLLTMNTTGFNLLTLAHSLWFISRISRKSVRGAIEPFSYLCKQLPYSLLCPCLPAATGEAALWSYAPVWRGSHASMCANMLVSNMSVHILYRLTTISGILIHTRFHQPLPACLICSEYFLLIETLVNVLTC